MNLHTHQSAPRTIQFGIHLMIDGYFADGAPMTDKEALRDILDRLPSEIGMHPICAPVVVEAGANCAKDPGGLSGFVMIAQSHISFRTFPESGFVTIDLYTCQDDLNTYAVLTRLKQAFKIKDADVYVQKRGVRYPASALQSGAGNFSTTSAV